MSHKIVPAKTFPGSSSTPALATAARWLDEQCKGGFFPLHVVAKGTDVRVILSGPEGGAIVFVKK